MEGFSKWKKLASGISKNIKAWWKGREKVDYVNDNTLSQIRIHSSTDGLAWGRRYNYAVLLAYCGQRYYGMQVLRKQEFPTVEGQLLEALHKLALISKEEKEEPQLFRFRRTSRTDRGVSAVRQVCNMILPLGGQPRKYAHFHGFIYTPETVLDGLNACLPEDIRVFGIKRVTGKFVARYMCSIRHYTYTIPSYAFDPIHQTNFQNYRISADTRNRINSVLSLYLGPHNFYNFTRLKLPNERSCRRIIRACECSEPFVRNGIEFMTIHLVGDSFMQYQIRKMVGLCIAIVRGCVGMEAMEKCWLPVRYDIPIAPGLGLVLNNLYFNIYHRRYGKTHEPLVWHDCKDKLAQFREQHIDSVIYNAEVKDNSPVREWLENALPYHRYDRLEKANGEDVTEMELESEPEPEAEMESEMETDNEERSQKVPG